MSVPLLATALRILRGIAGGHAVPMRWRHRILRPLGLRGLDSPALGHGIVFTDPTSVTCGAGCFINDQVYFDGGGVRIGRNVSIGPRSMFLTGTHDHADHRRRAGAIRHLPISVSDGVWIGAGVTVLPGVRIEEGCVIAAGAVVTERCAPHGLYAGVPAHRVKDLPLTLRGPS